MEFLEEEPAPSAIPRLCLSFALTSTSAVLFCIAVHVRYLLYVVVGSCSIIHGGAPLRHCRSCSSAIASSASLSFVLVCHRILCVAVPTRAAPLLLLPWSLVPS
ncbi:uncharacterized protein DS421_15g518620 [Arachis hypogaea]|nr:uncharacterized protein DS421_15g518620 [Arachis hypogaea]